MSIAGRKIAVNGIILNVIAEGDGPSVFLLHRDQEEYAEIGVL